MSIKSYRAFVSVGPTGGGVGVSGGGRAGERVSVIPSTRLSVARSESLRVESVVLPPSTARMVVENRRGEW